MSTFMCIDECMTYKSFCFSQFISSYHMLNIMCWRVQQRILRARTEAWRCWCVCLLFTQYAGEPFLFSLDKASIFIWGCNYFWV